MSKLIEKTGFLLDCKFSNQLQLRITIKITSQSIEHIAADNKCRLLCHFEGKGGKDQLGCLIAYSSYYHKTLIPMRQTNIICFLNLIFSL